MKVNRIAQLHTAEGIDDSAILGLVYTNGRKPMHLESTIQKCYTLDMNALLTP